MFRIVAWFLLICSGFFSCQSVVETGEQNSSVLTGTVLRGPMCPVVTENDSCPDQPFSALFHVINQQGTEETSFQSDQQGDFTVSLLPGEYTIIADETAPLLPIRQAMDIEITNADTTRVILNFDTGIR